MPTVGSPKIYELEMFSSADSSSLALLGDSEITGKSRSMSRFSCLWSMVSLSPFFQLVPVLVSSFGLALGLSAFSFLVCFTWRSGRPDS